MNNIETLENFESVKYRIRAEGMDYTFIHYSTFEAVMEDPKFHELRKSYIKASEDLQKYINERIEDLQNEDDEE